MKKVSVLLAFVVLIFTGLAAANSAVVTSATGTVQVQTGDGPARTLRVGDEVRQGDTIFTRAASSVVLKFDDGQVAALTANSRLAISAYQYNPASGSGNVLLSLVSGGMRAITGLIGRRTPQNVAYRAATATIGIRGTDVTIVTDGGNVIVTVTEGAISFTFAGRTITISAGQGVNARLDGTFQQSAAEKILAQLPPEVARLIGGLQGLVNAINQAAPGVPRDGAAGFTPGDGAAGTSGGPTGGGGGVGGGTASPS